MTDEESKQFIKFIKEHTAKLLKSEEATWQYFIKAGIKTEEDRKKHEAKKRRKERMK